MAEKIGEMIGVKGVQIIVIGDQERPCQDSPPPGTLQLPLLVALSSYIVTLSYFLV